MYRIHNPNTGHGFDPVETEDPAAWIALKAIEAGFDPEGYISESSIYVEPVPPSPDPTIKLIADMKFGQELILQFLLDNRNDSNVKTSDSLILLQKFQAVKELLSLGDIKKCVPLINYMTVDSIFTQERKTKYIDMINAYLSN